MRVAKVLAVSLLLTAGPVSAAFALDPANDQPNGTGNASEPAPATNGAAETAMEHQQSAPAEAAPAAAATEATPPPAQAPAPQANTPEAPQPGSSADAAAAAPATETAAPATATTASEPPKLIADDRLVYLPVADYIQNNAKKALAGTDADDRQVLIKFYTSRMGSTLWVDKQGYTAGAKNLIAALQDADSWGLRSADFKIRT